MLDLIEVPLLYRTMNTTLMKTFTLDSMMNMTRNTSLLTQAHYLANFTDSLLPVLVLIVTQPTQVSKRKVHALQKGRRSVCGLVASLQDNSQQKSLPSAKTPKISDFRP